jgi:hypothetical protein
MINNPRLILGRDEGTDLGFFHTLNAAGAGIVASLAAGVLTLTVTGGGGGSFALSSFSVTLPYPTVDAIVNVIDASVTGTSKILLADGHYADTDTNDPSDMYARVVSVAAGSFNVRITPNNREVIGGPFKFFYSIG